MTLRELKDAWRGGTLPKPAYVARMHEAHQALYAYADFIKDTAIGRIEITDGRIVMVTRDPEIKLIVHPTDRRLAAADMLNFGTYEAAETAMLRRLTPPGSTVLDVGANIGWHAMFLARTVPGVTVHAFEPVPETFRALEAHLALNGVTNVRPYCLGCSREPGRLTFFLPPESVNASAANLSGRPDARRVEVEVRRLDDVVRAEGLAPALLKIDVEGAELHVLEGAPDTLARHAPKVFAEMLRKWSQPFGYHPNDIIRLMRDKGYDCFTIREDGLAPFATMDDATVETNFLFLHRERHAEDIATFTRRK